MKNFILLITIFSCLIYCENKEARYLFLETEGYHQISKETIEFLIKKQNHPANFSCYDKYDFLFQKEPFDTLFTYPNIQIDINERERIQKSDLEKFLTLYYKYDKNTHYLWKYQKSKLHVIIPTNYGSINVYCYSTDENFEKDKIEFERFISSIIISDEAKYQGTFIRNSDLLYYLFYEGASSSVFGLIALFCGIITTIILSKRNLKFTSLKQ